jgi:hypothetical protein
MSIASKTANGEFGYLEEYFGRTLDNWVHTLHRHNCEMNGWRFFPLVKG